MAKTDKYSAALAILVYLASSQPLLASNTDFIDAKQHTNACNQIKSNTQRLACFDALSPQKTTVSLQKQRREQEKAHHDTPFMMQSYRPSYFLPVSYNPSQHKLNPNILFNSPKEGLSINNIEVKFQISFKLPLAQGLLFDNDVISMNYTQLSFWQLYNERASKPFRENNYEPELMWQVDFDDKQPPSILGLPLDSFGVSFNHQSNGRSNNFSLGWNRIIFHFNFSDKNWLIAFRPWIRMPGDHLHVHDNATDHYMGKFDLSAAYKIGQHTLSSKLRNNLNTSKNKGYLELNWSFPLPITQLKGFVQYSTGYGEVLIDYNHKVNRISAGFLLADWF
ncbi:phospholipase A(1) [Catenovulum agarivorans DS-2]|uniref:Phospholipase A1 n=1 Tax=Catenovulum agarivorans DS-2 TaxID=1328313 RepID=W7QI88_9ALTE|nr:phospholipase A [Catenovulum agarivorans]EWH11561.1 phospholipase A(1) [Catenovulum agarivorans DS-2]